MADSASIPTYPDLKAKVAVVTGGSKGVGAVTCRMLGRQGTKVAINGRDLPAIDRLVEDINADGGFAIGVPADCRDFRAIEAMRERVEAELGPADILIAFAGGFGSFTPVHLIDEAEWRSVVDSNLTTTFLTIKSFLPGMIERGKGAIVTMASNVARTMDITLTAPYAAAKAGVIVLSRHVAKEAGPAGVRVNCIAPATLLSERVHRIMPEARRKEVAELTPLRRLGEPEDAALATLFLVSDSSAYLTGVTLDVAGGRVMM